jgi:hypothetical protein
MAETENILSEAPGLYGTFSIEERVIQQIWNEQRFLGENLHTTEGWTLKIINPGKWNLAEEGPDFKEAKISLNGKFIHGDVEIHFEEKDWKSHGHGNDPRYNRVVLHVILFPPKNKLKSRIKNNQHALPTLVLLPYLLYGIEEYAENLALEKLAGDKNLSAEIPTSVPTDFEEVMQMAKSRWIEKCRHASVRLQNTDWSHACHQWFLEVLGYRRNRLPMAKIAQRYTLADWRSGLDPKEVYASQNDWKLRGCRPANHPLKRLKQYAVLNQEKPDWTNKLKEMRFDCDAKSPTFENRKSIGLQKKIKEWQDGITGGIFGDTRANTLLIDSALPLWAVKQQDAFISWFFWPAGDFPQKYRKWATQTGICHVKQPFCNGIGQAILHSLIQT